MRTFLWLGSLFAAFATVSTAYAADTASVEERISPLFVLAPTANLELGANALFGSELGGTVLFAPTPSLRLGVSAAWSREVTNSMEGCSIVTVCVRSWTRVAANFEHHLRPQSTVDVWWGVQAGPEWRRANVSSFNESTGGYDIADEKRTLAVIQPNVGVDFGGAVSRAFLGIGLYAGVPVLLGSEPHGPGLVFGIRGLLGVR